MTIRRASLAPLFAPALLALLAASCSSSDSTANSHDGGATAAFVASFDLPASAAPDFLQVPFPSDTQLAADGTIHVLPGTADVPTGLSKVVPGIGGQQFVVDGLQKTRGFGTYGGAIFELVGSTPDASKLPTGKSGDCLAAGSPVHLVDLDAAGGPAPIECQAYWSDDHAYTDLDDTKPVLTVSTARGVVLAEGHKIAVLLTQALTDASGTPLQASPGFVAVRDGAQTDAAAKGYASAIASAASKLAIDVKSVVSAAVYTTGKVTDALRTARDLAAAAPLPALGWSADALKPVTAAKFAAASPLPAGWTASLDDYLGTPNKLADGSDDPDFSGDTNPGVAHDAIGAMGHASFEAPNFLISVPDGYSSPNHATFFHAASGEVAINAAKQTARVWVTFVVPKTPAPAGGYPVVVFQHGMGGTRTEVLALANSFAKKGWATAAIELVQHGTRHDEATFRGDSKNDSHRSTSKYDGPDGFTDRSGDGSNPSPVNLFGGLFRLAALRDQMRQSAIDHATLFRILHANPSLDGLALGGVSPKLDGSKIAYVGDSLGGILGALVAGIQVEHAAYVLNVAGAGLMREIGPNAPNIYLLLKSAAGLNFGFHNEEIPPGHPLVQLLQHIVDGGDPIATASHAIMAPLAVGDHTPGPRNVLIYEVLADELVANEATEALGRALGLTILKPHTDLLASLTETSSGVHDLPVAGMTGTIVQLFPASHGYDLYGKPGSRVYADHTPIWAPTAHGAYPKLKPPIAFENPYLATQGAAIDFIDQAFHAKVPTFTWTRPLAPVSDH